jgi:hypothetical protein
VEACVNAHEKARLSIVGEDYAAAQQAVNACAASSCPLALRSDCAAWQSDLERVLPTLLVVIERGASGQPATLVLDGQRIALSEPSVPIQTVPGRHELVIELPPFAPVRQEVTLAKEEKNHLVRVRFAADSPPPPPSPPHIQTSRPLPWSTVALSGAAVAAFATSTALLASALSKRADARALCAPVCDESERSEIQSRLLLSDLSAGAGLIFAGLAVYTYWKRPVVSEQVALARPLVAFEPHALSLGLTGAF